MAPRSSAACIAVAGGEPAAAGAAAERALAALAGAPDYERARGAAWLAPLLAEAGLAGRAREAPRGWRRCWPRPGSPVGRARSSTAPSRASRAPPRPQRRSRRRRPRGKGARVGPGRGGEGAADQERRQARETQSVIEKAHGPTVRPGAHGTLTAAVEARFARMRGGQAGTMAIATRPGPFARKPTDVLVREATATPSTASSAP